MKNSLILLLLTVFAALSCGRENRVILGDERFGEYLPLLEGQRVAILSNQCSRVMLSHRVVTSSLYSSKVLLSLKVFSSHRVDISSQCSREDSLLQQLRLLLMHSLHLTQTVVTCLSKYALS